MFFNKNERKQAEGAQKKAEDSYGDLLNRLASEGSPIFVDDEADNQKNR